MNPIREKWPGEMTDRERFVAQMHRRPVDRCFNMEFGYWRECFDQWALFREHGITTNAEADHFFSFDRIDQVAGNTWLHPQFEEKVIGETEQTRIVQNAEGLTGEVPRDGHSTIPHFTDSQIKRPEDWEKVRDERLRLDDPARIIDIDDVRRRKGLTDGDRDYPLGVGCGSMIGKIRNLLTVEGLAYAVFDYPEMVEDMVETVCRLVEHSLDQLLPHIDFDFATGWEDISCNTGPLVSMGFFEQVIVPRYKRIGEKLANAGVDVWYTDSDGDVRPLIPGFLSAGLNTMFPWEINGSGHPGAALELWGSELRIMGGVDKMQLAAGREAIDRYLESLVPHVEGGGFIPFCDHRCPPNVDPDDYLDYLDRKRDLFGMKQR